GSRQLLGHRLGTGAAQRIGLRTSAPLGDRLGEVGKQHGEPKPHGQLARERSAAAGHQIADEQYRDEHRHDGGYEDHRIAKEVSGIKLGERIHGGPFDECRIGDRTRIPLAACVEAFLGDFNHDVILLEPARAQNVLPSNIWKCSTSGPSASDGKYSSPLTIARTPTSRPTNKGPLVGNVPADGASFGLAASDPMIAMTGTMMPKRQASMAMPRVVSYQGAFAVRPAKAEPLLPAALEKA